MLKNKELIRSGILISILGCILAFNYENGFDYIKDLRAIAMLGFAKAIVSKIIQD